MQLQLSEKIKTALVTGASSGIGLEYCTALAKQGVNLVIVARDMQRLQMLAEKLSAEYSVNITIIKQDLSDAGAAKNIFTSTEDANIKIDLLINNAGYADKAHFLDCTLNDHAQMINCMLLSIVDLCHLYMPQMIEQKFGYIINLGSVAGLVGYSKSEKAMRTLYRPIKSFVILFTEQLAKSYAQHGLVLQCLCPGLTVSDFHNRSGEGYLYDRLPKFFWLPGCAVVAKSLRALSKPKKVILVTGWVNKLIVFVWRLTHLTE